LEWQVKNYFNTEGFSRWQKIYGETDEVNKVQLDIRTGHAVTVEKVLAWFQEEGSLEGVTVADAGCGTGSLAIPLALRVRFSLHPSIHTVEVQISHHCLLACLTSKYFLCHSSRPSLAMR
jgi:methylase of polypeptide subunit release factors